MGDAFARVVLEIVLDCLWQGALVAASAALLAVLLRRTSAATRYAMWSAALAALVVLPAASAVARFRPTSPSPRAIVATAGSAIAGVGVDESGDVRVESATTPTAFVTVDGVVWPRWVFVALVALWAAGLVRFVAGIRAILRYRRRSTPIADARVARLAGWRRAIGGGRGAVLATSPDARTPMVLGLGRPIVVIPESLVERLTDAELDQIALHELAHVRRRDDWAKVLQSSIETICCFHPAARWLARRADAEREFACDDWVLFVTRERRGYAQCLLKLAGLRLASASVPAPGAVGRKPMISERIELVMKTNRNAQPKPSTFSRLALTAALAGAVALCFTSGPAVALTGRPVVETPPAGGPRDATPRSGPEPTAVASRGASTKVSLQVESREAIARDSTNGEIADVRRAAIAALDGRAGTVLVMDAKSGRMLAAVNQEWGFRRGFPAASTIKLVTALAGLEAGTLDPSAVVSAQGQRVDLERAIATSNTEYFDLVGERVGFDRFMAAARGLGLGEPTASDYGAEYAGVLPTSEVKGDRVFGVGAGVEVTPAQLVSLAASLGNGGTLLAPRMPRDGVFGPVVRRAIGVSPASVRRILPGLLGTVEYGTGSSAAVPGHAVAGKTGTADGPDARTGLFLSFAPANDAQFAVVVVIRGKGVLGADAAAIAGKVYRALFNC